MALPYATVGQVKIAVKQVASKQSEGVTKEEVEEMINEAIVGALEKSY